MAGLGGKSGPKASPWTSIPMPWCRPRRTVVRGHQSPDPRAQFYTEETRILTRKQDSDRTPYLTDLELRMRTFDEMGVDAQVITPAPGQCYYGVPAEIGIKAARVVNEGIADIVRSSARPHSRRDGLGGAAGRRRGGGGRTGILREDARPERRRGVGACRATRNSRTPRSSRSGPRSRHSARWCSFIRTPIRNRNGSANITSAT